jgi:hypothetical protein
VLTATTSEAHAASGAPPPSASAASSATGGRIQSAIHTRTAPGSSTGRIHGGADCIAPTGRVLRPPPDQLAEAPAHARRERVLGAPEREPPSAFDHDLREAEVLGDLVAHGLVPAQGVVDAPPEEQVLSVGDRIPPAPRWQRPARIAEAREEHQEDLRLHEPLQKEPTLCRPITVTTSASSSRAGITTEGRGVRARPSALGHWPGPRRPSPSRHPLRQIPRQVHRQEERGEEHEPGEASRKAAVIRERTRSTDLLPSTFAGVPPRSAASAPHAAKSRYHCAHHSFHGATCNDYEA